MRAELRRVKDDDGDPLVNQWAVLIYRRTGSLGPVQLLLGHSKIESTVRCLCIEVDDASADKIDI